MTLAVLTEEQLEALVTRAVERALGRGTSGSLSTAEAARVAGRSPKTIRDWVASGALPAGRRGRSIVIQRADLERLLAGTSPTLDLVRSLRG